MLDFFKFSNVHIKLYMHFKCILFCVIMYSVCSNVSLKYLVSVMYKLNS